MVQVSTFDSFTPTASTNAIDLIIPTSSGNVVMPVHWNEVLTNLVPVDEPFVYYASQGYTDVAIALNATAQDLFDWGWIASPAEATSGIQLFGTFPKWNTTSLYETPPFMTSVNVGGTARTAGAYQEGNSFTLYVMGPNAANGTSMVTNFVWKNISSNQLGYADLESRVRTTSQSGVLD